uniref:Uncharacterized protein n=1 Tax=Romanomermis culicivorax TaxID=13658 RepID=A0A915L063_ROMCU
MMEGEKINSQREPQVALKAFDRVEKRYNLRKRPDESKKTEFSPETLKNSSKSTNFDLESGDVECTPLVLLLILLAHIEPKPDVA